MRYRNAGLWAVAIAAALTFAGCQSAPKAEEKDAAADLAAINALRAKYVTTFNSNDAAGLAAIYADDAIEMPSNAPTVEGRAAIQSNYEAMFKGNPAKIAITSVELHVAGDWAYDRGTATTTITEKSGRTMEESSRYLVILKRLPGNLWKLYREVDANDAPPPPPPAKKAGKKGGKKGKR